MNIIIRKLTASDREWVLEIIRSWGADFIVSRGRKIYAAEIEGFAAEDQNGKKMGLVTFEIVGDQCQIVTLDAFSKFSGIGTALVDSVKKAAIERGCGRLWLITTNDNIDAIRFYHKRGFVIAAVHVNALEYSRKLKPSIPVRGYYGIAVRDEIEFEMMLR